MAHCSPQTKTQTEACSLTCPVYEHEHVHLSVRQVEGCILLKLAVCLQLTEALNKNKYLTSLDLSDNRIGDAGAEVWLPAEFLGVVTNLMVLQPLCDVVPI